MDIKSDAVAERVTETSLVSGFIDNIASDSVEFVLSSLSVYHSLNRRGLRRVNGVVNLSHRVVGFTEHYCSRHIGAVTVDLCAEVHSEKSFFEFNVSRNSVRHRRRFARHRDSLERRTFGAVRSHEKFKFERDVYLGLVGGYIAENVRKRRVGHRLRLFHFFYFRCVLEFAEAVEYSRSARHELRRLDFVLYSFKIGKREGCLFDVYFFDAVVCRYRVYFGEHSVWHYDFKPFVRLGFRRLDISEIGYKRRAFFGDENISVGVVKTRYPSLVDVRRYKQRAALGE